MPGNRVNSHRALVVIGNLKGTGGMGMGKASTPGAAVDAAFRYARANASWTNPYTESAHM